MEKTKRMTTIIVAGVLLLTVIGVTVAYFAVSVINGTRQNLSATTVESVNLTLDDNDQTSYSGQVSFESTITRNLKLTNEGGPTKVALYFQDLINTYTAGAFTYTLSYATTRNGSYNAVATDVAIPRRSKTSSTAKITEIEMPATTTRYYRIVITYNNLPEVNQTRDLTAQFKTGFTIKSVPKTLAEAHPNGDYLKDYCAINSYGNCMYQTDNITATVMRRSVLGNSNIAKTFIININILNSKTPPTGTEYVENGSPWDVSEAGNGSVMAWVTNHNFELYYKTMSDCTTDLNSGNVKNCKNISPITKYFYYDETDGYDYTNPYDTLDDCTFDLGSEEYCRSDIVSIVGYYTQSQSYDLYIGQDGGVIANNNSARLFDGYTSVTNIEITNLNTEYITNMNKMFYNLSELRNVDLSNFNTSKVTDMSMMLSGLKALKTSDLSSFDTSNVTDMGNMFSNCTVLTSLNLSNFDTANVTSLWGTFSGCKAITTFNLSNFDTSNVTNMSYMFDGCWAVTSLDLSSFDTACVTTMEGMFEYLCNSSKAITSLDLSHFDTSNVTKMWFMFHVSSITTVRFDKASFESITNISENNPFSFSSVNTVYLNQSGKDYFESNWLSWDGTIIVV